MDTKILIAVPGGESTRYGRFWDSYFTMERPSGTVHAFTHGSSPASGRNMMIRQALEANCTHVFFIDDDVIPPPNIVTRLLSHDKDVCGALYLLRNHPHFPAAFDMAVEGGFNRHLFLRDENTGLVPVTNLGLGAVLIKIDVFKKLEEPWIRLGQITKDEWCDDIEFFNRVREAGFEMFCDLDIHCAHIMSVAMKPVRHEGKWYVDYDVNGSGQVRFPATVPESVEDGG